MIFCSEYLERKSGCIAKRLSHKAVAWPDSTLEIESDSQNPGLEHCETDRPRRDVEPVIRQVSTPRTSVERYLPSSAALSDSARADG